MNYEETLSYLFSQLPMFQRVGKAAYRDNLDNTLILDQTLGHPHQQFPSIHIAGTNGKGSVSHMLAAILQKAGYTTGLCTSPHFIDYRERIRVNGEMIEKDYVMAFVEKHKTVFDRIKPSFFEMSIALAFDYFAFRKVDMAVIETGMGGRLDSTNIITPQVSVITNIGYDHMQYLGDSLPKIAREKAGIIKPGVPVVIGQTQPESMPVFIEMARKQKAPITFADQIYWVNYSMLSLDQRQVFHLSSTDNRQFTLVTDLLGLYQRKNILTVLATLDVVKATYININEKAVTEALAEVGSLTGLVGRWQVLNTHPLVVADMGHNPDGLAAVAEQIRQTPHRHLHFVYGMVNDKDTDKILQILPRDAFYYFTRANIPRAMDPAVLCENAQHYGLKGMVFQTVREAFRSATEAAGRNDLVVVGGSAFVVAEVL
jgi:dihydrofolate synthase/folylpolyglutamate synthase